jgi:tetraacyldisaccharide 4'-kinase
MYTPHAVPPPRIHRWALPLAALYGAVVRLRHFLYDTGVLRSEYAVLPTVVVGNVAVGGTGKTPLTLLLAAEVTAWAGEGRVAILSRGYRRTGSGFRIVEVGDRAEVVGDEPLMMKRAAPGCVVAVCADRLEGVRRLKAERPDVRWVLLDDGWQHRRLRPDLAVAAVDATRPVIGDALLPAGRLRDLPSRLRTCDAAVVTRCPEGADPRAVLRGLAVVPEGRPVWGVRAVRAIVSERALEGRPRVVAVAGIARPERFFEGLADRFDVCAALPYPDHTRFTEADVEVWRTAVRTSAAAALVLTEKDAVRLGPLADRLADIPIWVERLAFVLDDAEAFRSWLHAALAAVPVRGRW